MAEIQMFQPGTAFMNSYNQAKAGSLAKIAFTEPQRRQSALADLYGLDPQAANSMKKEFDAQEQEQLKTFATAFMNTTDDNLRTQMYGRAKEMWRPRFQALGSDIPDDWRQALPTIQALAGAGLQQSQDPAAVREIDLIADRLGLKRGTPEYTKFVQTQYNMIPRPADWKYGETNSGLPSRTRGDEYEVYNPQTRGWDSFSGVAKEPQSSEFIGNPTTVQTDNEAPVDFNTLPADEQKALALASEAAQQGNPFHYTVRGGVVGNASPAPKPAAPVAQAAPAGQFDPFTKPEAPVKWSAPTPVNKNGKIVMVQFSDDGTKERERPDLAPLPAAGTEKTTEDMRKTATLLSRMNFSLNQIREVEATDKAANRPGYGIAALDYLPEAVANDMKSSNRQIVESAQLDALDAALTLATGAAYTKEQLIGLRKSYFPGPNDDEATVRAKQARFQNVIESARVRAGGAALAPPQRPAGNAQPPAGGQGKYSVGQVLVINGKRYQVTGGDMNDPDLKELK